MHFEERLQQEMQMQASTMQVPAELDTRIWNSYRLFARQARGSKRKKRPLLAAALAGLVLLPTSAMAYSYMNDDLYGSFAQFQKECSIATQDLYMQFAMKLSGAQSTLGDADYEKFLALLKLHNVYVVEYGDRYGHIDSDALSAAQRAGLKQVNLALQPYFDKLNHDRSSKDVLTSTQFDQYIEAQMTYDSILAKMGYDDKKALHAIDVPVAYRNQFVQAQQVIRSVSQQISPPKPLDGWMQNAKDVLGDCAFAKFQAELQQMSDLQDQYGNDAGLIDYGSVHASVRMEAKQLLEQDQDFRNQIAHRKPLHDILTSSDYDQYFNARIDSETVLAKSGQDLMGGQQVDLHSLSNDLKGRYVRDKKIIEEATAKQKVTP